ncbi:MAG: hypothetical protein ABIJ86_01175, partial [Spirochaetota bacterium]
MLALLAFFSLFPTMIHAQEPVLATVAINGVSVAELLGSDEDGQVWFEPFELKPILDGRIRQDVLAILFVDTTRLGMMELQSAGMDVSWDPLNLVFSIQIPASLTVEQVFAVTRKPGPLLGELVEPESFSAILNFSGRVGYTSEGEDQEFPFS